MRLQIEYPKAKPEYIHYQEARQILNGIEYNHKLDFDVLLDIVAYFEKYKGIKVKSADRWLSECSKCLATAPWMASAENDFYENYIEKENYCILVATIDDEIVGYVYGYKENSGNTLKDSVAILDALFVFPEHRGEQIGTDLFECFKDWCLENDIPIIETKVFESNDCAFNLYLNQGFEPHATILKTRLY